MGELFAGRYELLDPVASGGMGTVWTVRDHTDGALKVAKILQQSDAASLLRFVREQSVRIDHRHVVTPQSWAGMDDRVLFTMPLVRGGSVSDLVRTFGALPARWVVALLDQTLQALEAVHAAGIVHRDVKPANLLLEPTGRERPHLRLTDFGIAAPVDEPRMTRASMAIGTPGYMAPEQEHGADPHPAQDVYAVGIVGLEMLSATRPPAQGGAAAMRVPWAEGSEPEPVRRLVALLRRAADPDPSRRPPSATAVRAELAALDLAGVPVEATERVEVTDRFAALLAQHPDQPRGQEAPTVGRGTPLPTRTAGRSAPRPAATLPDAALLRGGGLVALGALCLVLALLLVLG